MASATGFVSTATDVVAWAAAHFHGDDGNVAEAFTPCFNTLNLLRVPTPHSVTQVALSAGEDRISVTGWLRGHEAPAR